MEESGGDGSCEEKKSEVEEEGRGGWRDIVERSRAHTRAGLRAVVAQAQQVSCQLCHYNTLIGYGFIFCQNILAEISRLEYMQSTLSGLALARQCSGSQCSAASVTPARLSLTLAAAAAAVAVQSVGRSSWQD